MPGNTFRTSRSERSRRRADGPTLTLVRGTADSPGTSTGATRPAHPAIEGFTPVDLSAGPRRWVDRDSEPEANVPRGMSRGSTSPDSGRQTPSGSGPNFDQLAVVQLIADFLEATAGEPDGSSRPSGSDVRPGIHDAR